MAKVLDITKQDSKNVTSSETYGYRYSFQQGTHVLMLEISPVAHIASASSPFGVLSDSPQAVSNPKPHAFG